MSAARHAAVAVGVYSYFFAPVTVRDGVVAANRSGFVQPFTRKLDGEGGIEHVINGVGGRQEGCTGSWRHSLSGGGAGRLIFAPARAA